MAKTYKPIESAFKELRELGFFAESNHLCCQSCGFASVPKGKDNVVFYHGQDADELKKSGSCYLSWSGDVKKIIEVLEKHDIKVEWNGSEYKRILITL